MNLSKWAADVKRALFDELMNGSPPSTGEYDPDVLEQAKAKGKPQMGATVYTPDAARFEFIYSEPTSSTILVSVRVAAPERIVYLPVPDWVVENVWQGSVDGSYGFESEALVSVDRFRASLEPDTNANHFGPRPATRRE